MDEAARESSAVKKALLVGGVVGGGILLAMMILTWRDRVPEPPATDCTEVVLDPRVPVMAKVCGEAPPVAPPAEPEPLEPTKPPDLVPVIWGPCAEIASSRQRSEDAWLREVLASTVQNSPLFGVAEWSMSAAECAAYRERIAWMK